MTDHVPERMSEHDRKYLDWLCDQLERIGDDELVAEVAKDPIAAADNMRRFAAERATTPRLEVEAARLEAYLSGVTDCLRLGLDEDTDNPFVEGTARGSAWLAGNRSARSFDAALVGGVSEDAMARYRALWEAADDVSDTCITQEVFSALYDAAEASRDDIGRPRAHVVPRADMDDDRPKESV